MKIRMNLLKFLTEKSFCKAAKNIFIDTGTKSIVKCLQFSNLYKYIYICSGFLLFDQLI